MKGKKRAQKVRKRYMRKAQGKKILWGLWDTKDKVWLGNETGAVTYEDEWDARLAAEVTGKQVGWSATRVRARPFDHVMRLKDKVPVKMDALTALEILESGRYI